jgi:hypothetical protein
MAKITTNKINMVKLTTNKMAKLINESIFHV